MNSLVEVLRSLNEEREKVEDAIVQELVCRKYSKKHEINSGHLVKELMERHKTISLKILEMFKDKNNLMKNEINSLCGSNEFAEFYGKLRSIKEHHRKFMTDTATTDAMTMEFDKLAENRAKDVEDDNIKVNFTDEEGFGRYLDLHEQYLNYLNLSKDFQKDSNKITYLKYLEIYDKLYKINSKVRESKMYLEAYLNPLYEYLIDYVKRAFPLLNLEMELAKADHIFEINCENNSVIGWDLSLFDSIENKKNSESSNNFKFFI